MNINNLIPILVIGVVVIAVIILTCKENFTNDNLLYLNEYVQTVPTIEEQMKENDSFLEEYKKLRKIDNKNNENPILWNKNNTLESMVIKPCLNESNGRLTCYSAPSWWYPNDKYEPDKFREIYYGDYYNPIYNYLGNAQDMFWDFKSVRND